MTIPSRILSLRQLHAFEAVARFKSVSAAAAEINLSQPGVTHAIDGLEDQIGTALLKRDRTGSYLTEIGEIFLPRVRRMFAHMRLALCEPLVGAPFAEHVSVGPLQNKIKSTHVRCLIAVSKSSSFEDAARMLGVSQPSLHRAARELERVLQRSIYERTARGVTTTPQGTELARRLQIALREIDYGIEEIRAAQGIVTSRIVVGNIPHSDTNLLSTGINDLLSRYPDACVEVNDGNYFSLLHDLRVGKIDILFGVLRRPRWITDVDEEKLFSNTYSVVVRKGHPITRLAKITRRDLARHDWIMPTAAAPRRQAFEKILGGMKHPPKVSVETNSIAVCRALLAASDRISLMSRHEALSEESSDRLAMVPFYSPALVRSDGIAVRKDWHPTGIHLRFLQLLRERAQRAPEGRLPGHGNGARRRRRTSASLNGPVPAG